MKVADMAPGMVFWSGFRWNMRIKHPNHNCVDLEDGELKTLESEYEPVKWQLESLGSNEWQRFGSIERGTAIGYCSIRVSGGYVNLNNGHFYYEPLDEKWRVHSNKVVICS